MGELLMTPKIIVWIRTTNSSAIVKQSQRCAAWSIGKCSLYRIHLWTQQINWFLYNLWHLRGWYRPSLICVFEKVVNQKTFHIMLPNMYLIITRLYTRLEFLGQQNHASPVCLFITRHHTYTPPRPPSTPFNTSPRSDIWGLPSSTIIRSPLITNIITLI